MGLKNKQTNKFTIIYGFWTVPGLVDKKQEEDAK
jgi:hypothetical protein